MAQPAQMDTLRDVKDLLNARRVSFASLVIDALRDPESSLANDFIEKIADVLDALRPHLDDGSIIELGRFFASIAGSELTELGKDELWHLPATKLSAERLQMFNMKKMSERIAAVAPGFSSFLHSVCVGKRVLSEVVVDDDEAGVRPDVRRSVDPAQLLEIVCVFTCHVYLTHVEIEEDNHYEHYSECPQQKLQCVPGRYRNLPPFNKHPRQSYQHSPSRWTLCFAGEHLSRYQVTIGRSVGISFLPWRQSTYCLRLRQFRCSLEGIDANG